MSHPYVDTDQLPVPFYITDLGMWADVTIPDDGDDRNAAVAGVGLEALADRTTWLRYRLETTSAYGSTDPSIKNNGVTLGTSNSYVLKKALSISSLVPVGGSGYTSPTLWKTPTVPFMIDGAFIRLTGNSGASIPPVSAQLDLLLGANRLIYGTLSPFVAGIMAINGTTLNKSVFGLAPADYGPLFDGTVGNNGNDIIGGYGGGGKLVAHTAISGSTLCNTAIKLRLTHGAASAVTFTMLLEVVIYGKLL